MFTVFLLFFAAAEEPALEVIQRAQQKVGTRLQSDPTLTLAARCLANAAKNGKKLETSLIRFCTDQAEVYDAALVPLLGEAAATTDFLASLVPYFRDEAQKRGLTHYGAATITDGQKRILAMFATLRRGTLQVSVDCKTKRMKVSGTIEPGHKRARAFLTDTQGLVGPLDLAVDKNSFTADAPVFVAGRYQLEILADAKDGPHVIANRAVYACVPKASAPPPPQAKSSAAPTDRLLALINEARKQAGVAPLALDAAVAKVAQSYAAVLKAEGTLAHSSKNGQTLADRLKSAGVAYNRAAENLSAAPTADDAHHSLMSSPGHRKNIVDPELTHVGIGVLDNPLSNGEPNLLFVIDFVTRPKSSSPEAFAEEVLTALNQLRAKNDVPPLKSDARLRRLAIDHSEQMAAAGKLAYQPSDKQFFAEARAEAKGADVDADLFFTSDVETIKKSQNAPKPASKVAIGVAQKDGMFYVTVIYVR